MVTDPQRRHLMRLSLAGKGHQGFGGGYWSLSRKMTADLHGLVPLPICSLTVNCQGLLHVISQLCRSHTLPYLLDRHHHPSAP
jgi:hypothetical protein